MSVRVRCAISYMLSPEKYKKVPVKCHFTVKNLKTKSVVNFGFVLSYKCFYIAKTRKTFSYFCIFNILIMNDTFKSSPIY